MPLLAIPALVSEQNAAHVVHGSHRPGMRFTRVRILGFAAAFHIAVDRSIEVSAVAQPPIH